MKATKLTLAAVLLAGTVGWRWRRARWRAATSRRRARTPIRRRPQQAQPGETKSAPAQGAQAPAATGSKQVQNPDRADGAGAETGTARDTAGTGANVKAAGSGTAEQGKHEDARHQHAGRLQQLDRQHEQQGRRPRHDRHRWQGRQRQSVIATRLTATQRGANAKAPR